MQLQGFETKTNAIFLLLLVPMIGKGTLHCNLLLCLLSFVRSNKINTGFLVTVLCNFNVVYKYRLN